MKKRFLSVAAFTFFGMMLNAQQIKFEEYDLPNGLHVILHQDNSAPVVTTGVMSVSYTHLDVYKRQI